MEATDQAIGYTANFTVVALVSAASRQCPQGSLAAPKAADHQVDPSPPSDAQQSSSFRTAKGGSPTRPAFFFSRDGVT
jgi:hypothetical protein